MMRLLAVLVFCIVLAASGCTRPAASGFRDGDRCVSELQYAPAEPWTAGTKVTLGMLLKLERSSGEVAYVMDTDIVPEKATMSATITYWDGLRRMGQPLEVPFVRDC
jgi:hypothetical protein